MLSFIVPAYNEEFELASTIASIRAAAVPTGKPFEIIVVDDGSTDATAQIARRLAVTLVHVRKRQIAATRNAGAKAAQGRILFFVDADTRISASHTTGAIAALEAGCSGGGARVAIDGRVPLWARIFFGTFTIVYFGNNFGAGAFLFTTRENFERIGGFDENLFVGEEVFFSLALRKLGRFKILRSPVLTSGRKLRMYSAGQILFRFTWILIRGTRGARSRDNLELWYEGKRESQ